MGWKTFVLIAIAGYIAFHSVDRFDPASIKDKRVVITGASSGIGEQIAYHYARLGARVLITARREAVLEKVVAKCKELGAREAFYIALDMAREDHPAVLIEEAKRRFAGLDHLILNHIINLYPAFWGGDFEGVLKRTMDINFHAYVRLATYATPMLRESEGHIGVVSSGAGKIGLPFVTVYSASKFALHGFFDGLRQEYDMQKSGISISTFVLGGINTTNASQHPSRIFASQTFTASPSDAALRIVKGTANREREVYFPLGTSLPVLLRDFAPAFVEWIVQSRALNRDAIEELVEAQGRN